MWVLVLVSMLILIGVFLLTLGTGGMCLGLSRLYGELTFIVQDRPQVLDKAQAVWHAGSPGALERGAITFMPHDFFKPNPVQGADVCLLRCVL